MQKINSLKKYLMWYKVKELKSKGLNQSQISRELDIYRGTVRHYLSMDEDAFLTSGSYVRQYCSKLSTYDEYIKCELSLHPYLSSSQIYDRLRENFPNLPSVHSKTVYNQVCKVRLKYNIPKCSDVNMREFGIVPESEYGEYAQVDFGEKWVYTIHKRSKKVYFFVMILSRSRYKFVYHQQRPFTTLTAIYAHELAFSYFGGIPKKIVYDQDKVFIHSENLGDYLLTREFKSFVNSHHFETIFCRKSDPQSKGKVENAVKYVKNNFLRGRAFSSIDALNEQALSWLSRTGNGLTHSSTQLIPSAVFEQEQSFLMPYHGTPTPVEELSLEYLVRKDNTINYKGNFYSLPRGTYTSGESRVVVNITGRELNIYSKERGKLIVTHTLSLERGKIIINPTHRRRDNSSILDLEKQILSYLKDNEIAIIYLEGLSRAKPRYYIDNMKYLLRYLSANAVEEIIDKMTSHINKNLFNAGYLVTDLSNTISLSPNLNLSTRDRVDIDLYQPEKRSINAYKNIF